MGRSKQRKSKKNTHSDAISGATSAPTSGGESEVQPTAPARADASNEAAKEAAKVNDIVHELAHSVDPIAKALSAIDDSDIDYKLEGDCPICLEALPPHWEPQKRVMAYCCGALSCTKCANERLDHINRSFDRKGYCDKADRHLFYNCSLCRQKCPPDGTNDEAMLLENAAKGRAWAQHNLGHRHLTGKDVLRPNARLGMELMTRSAKQGYPPALFDLGFMYSEASSRFGIKKAISNARFCYEEAANRGHTGARFRLACVGVLEDKHEEALKHLRIAAKAGYPKAIFSLGWFLYQGSEGNEKSISRARLYLEQAADLGDQDAVDFLKDHFD